MSDGVRQQLLGFLLGALEEPEQKQIADQLEKDPALRRKLARLQRSLQPLKESRREYAPPPGLADRTCRFVAQVAEHERRQRRPALEVVAMSPVPAPPVAATRWSWADLAVAVGIFAAASLLLFPAISKSRFNAQVAACQDNLRQIGVALTQYSHLHQDYFPQVPHQGRLAAAGIYAPTLVYDGFLPNSRYVICPTSPQAADPQFRVPTAREILLVESPEELENLRSVMGGSYGYVLGYIEGNQYRTTKNLRRPFFAVMADAPGDGPQHQSLNHGGRGQNVLFEDGRVVFYTSSRPSDALDDIFVNDAGQVAAGAHRNDSVIGASRTVPVVLSGARGE